MTALKKTGREPSVREKEWKEIFRGKRRIFRLLYAGSVAAIFILTAAVMIWGSLAVDGTLEFMIRDLKRTSWRDIRLMLCIILLYSLPFWLFYSQLLLSERQCMDSFCRMGGEEQAQLLALLSARRQMYQHAVKAGDILMTGRHFLYREKWRFFFFRIAAYEDIVWMYLSGSFYQYTDWEKGVASPDLYFHTIVFYTRDGKKHSIFMGDHRALAKRCPTAVKGYGKEQKTQALQRLAEWKERSLVMGEYEKKRSAVHKGH